MLASMVSLGVFLQMVPSLRPHCQSVYIHRWCFFCVRAPVILDQEPTLMAPIQCITPLKALPPNKLTFWGPGCLGLRPMKWACDSVHNNCVIALFEEGREEAEFNLYWLLSSRKGDWGISCVNNHFSRRQSSKVALETTVIWQEKSPAEDDCTLIQQGCLGKSAYYLLKFVTRLLSSLIISTVDFILFIVECHKK